MTQPPRPAAPGNQPAATAPPAIRPSSPADLAWADLARQLTPAQSITRIDAATGRAVTTITAIGLLLTGLGALGADQFAKDSTAATALAVSAVIVSSLAVACALVAQVLTISRHLNPANLEQVKAWYRRQFIVRAYATKAATMLLIVAALLAGATAATVLLTASASLAARDCLRYPSAGIAQHRASTFSGAGPSGAESASARAMQDSRGLGFGGITPVYRQTGVPASPSRSRSRSQGVRLPVPTNDAMYHTYRSDLSEVRALVLGRAREAGLAEGRANDLVLAVSEVAANTLRHTGSSGTLAIWHNEREIVCEIRDEGIITDPMAGQVRPAPDATGGHGLWLVYQVCDFVELNSDASGTTVRMHMALPASNGGR